MTTFSAPKHDRYRDDRANIEDDRVIVAGHIDDAGIHTTRGTSFPGSPVDGQLFTRTDQVNDKTFYYDTSRSLWLGVDLHQLQFGYAGNLAASTYARAAAGNVVCSATAGTLIPFPKVTFTGYTYTANAAATGNFEVRANGTLITSFTISHASAAYGADMTINLPYDGTGILSVYNDAGGIIGNPVVTLYFRRRIASS